MSEEAPHLELNAQDLPDLDPSAPSNQASYANGHSKGTESTVESTKNSILSCKVGRGPSEPYRDAPNGNASLICTSHTTTTAAPNNPTAAQSAMDSISNHPTTQNIKDSVNNGEIPNAKIHNSPPAILTSAGPVAQKAKAEGVKTRNEFADLANSRTTPDQPTATGQPLTHYHSLFYRLLSWKNPRATGISFAIAIAFIFAARYLNVIRYIFKAIYMVLGVTAGAEVAGKVAFGRGFTSQFRPRKYFVIPKASLERLLDDIEQFINFFVIESQRIVFAENVYATVAAFFAALISYGLIKFVPLWGLALIATTVAYLGPLVYIQNKEFIDAHLENGYNVVSQQTSQIRDLAAQHTNNATKTFQSYAGEYTNKAQDAINQYRGRSTSPEVKKEDFPAAPKEEPVVPSVEEHEPVAAS